MLVISFDCSRTHAPVYCSCWMRLLTVSLPDGTTSAAQREGDGLQQLVAPDGRRYPDVAALLRGGIDSAVRAPLSDAFSIRRPVLEPAATVCVGVNYGAHMREM